MIRLAVFDIAGTTVYDPDGVGQCLKEALTAAGVPWQHEEVNGIMGTPKPVAIAKLMEIAGVTGEVEPIFQDFRARMLAYYRESQEVCEIPGAEALFARLHANGIKVALDTGFDREIVDAVVARLGWADKVDFTVASDEVANGRPAPDLVYRAMELAGVTDVAEVAKIGDTPSDLGEGTAAACRYVIGVTYGTHREEQLRPLPHTHLAGSLEQVGDIILGG